MASLPAILSDFSVDRQAVDLLASKIEGKGPAWRNTANSVRSGYRNVWIEAALSAIKEALRTGAD